MTNTSIRIGQRVVDDPLDPYVIAEIGVNHEGDLDLAKRLVNEAADAGAHAAKFQTYKAGLIASRNSPAYWDTEKEPTRSQFDLFGRYDAFGPREYEALASHCARRGIDFLSTPFDLGAIEMLAPLVPAFKIASADITNVPLLRACARKGKPLILSTGASTLPEIAFAVDVMRAAGAHSMALLHCVLNYPCPPENAQLEIIRTLTRAFPQQTVGYSDHVSPGETMPALEMAALYGACILEKHFTHDKTLPGNDHYHAMDAIDLRRFMERMSIYRDLRGGLSRSLEHEQAARHHARRSIVAARDLPTGHLVREEDLIAKRPAHGISPVHWDEVVGRRLVCDVSEDVPLRWEMLECEWR